MLVSCSHSQLIAKLSKCRSRVSSAPFDKDSVWLYDPNAEEIWLHLCEYIDCAGKNCHPEAFQEYMLHKSNAKSLSYIAKKLAEELFNEKVKELIAQQHSAIMQKVQDQPSSKISTYPSHLASRERDVVPPVAVTPEA